MKKYAVILAVLGTCSDRFCGKYGRDYSLDEMFDRAASIGGVSGVELVGGHHVSKANLKDIKNQLERTNLQLVSVIPDIFSTIEYSRGGLASKDKNIRRKSLSNIKEIMDCTEELSGNIVSICALQDGYDYVFNSDYIREREWIEQGLKECCQHNKNIKIALEYKIKEPRVHSYINSAAQTMLMIKEVNEDNLGVTLDFGHSINAYENAADAVAIVQKYGKRLFHVHINDNYRLWDDDMIFGMVHIPEIIEFLYWLKRTEYSGWYSIDQNPYREDAVKSCDESILWMDKFFDILNTIDENEISDLFNIGDANQASAFIRKILFR